MVDEAFFSQIPEKMTSGEFWQLFGRREHAGLDFKRGVSRGLLDAIPAMAMTDGGVIVHGIDDDRRMVGCPFSQKTQDRITGFANECDVEVRIRKISVDGVELTVTVVPAIHGRIVTTPNGRLLRRVGGDSLPLRGDAMRRFVVARSEHPAEEQPLKRFDAEGFDLDLVNRVLDAAGRPSVSRSGLLRALMDLGVARRSDESGEPQVLWAAAVLFAENPAEHIPGATVQFVRRIGVGPDPGPSSYHDEVKAPLPDLVQRCLRMIVEHTESFEAVVGVKRETIPEYPQEVLREAIVNALAHRDYNLVGATVDITVWDDRVEITSPGPLPGYITLENMRTEHYSRNRRLMSVLKTMGLVEEYGEGVERMVQAMESRLLEPPVFDATPDSVTVTFFNRALISAEDQIWLRMLDDYPMTVEERRVLVVVRRKGSITPRHLRTLLPDVDASAVLAGAMLKGLLNRVGVRGGARYVLSDEIVMRAGTTGVQTRSRQQQKLLDEMDDRGSISTVEGAELLDEPMKVVRNLLNSLVQAGLARAEGRTRARRYHPTD